MLTFLLWGLLIYVTGGVLFLLYIRLQKDESGHPFLNPNSWHYKITRPSFSRKPSSWNSLKYPEISICLYYGELFFMLMVGWPLLIFFETAKTLIYTPFMLLFGYYPIPGFEYIRVTDGNPFMMHANHLRLPSAMGVKVRPGYILAPALYLAAFYYYPGRVGLYTGIIAVTSAIIFSLWWFLGTDNESVSLTREWLSARKKGLCITLPIKTMGDKDNKS